MKSVFLAAMLIASLLLPGQTNAQNAENTGGPTCEIEAWRWYYYDVVETLYIEGATTCKTGIITMRIYDGNAYIGNAEGLVNGHTFTLPVNAVTAKPSSVSIKYSIERE